MATIGSLNIAMSANSARLQKDLGTARKRTRRFSRGVSRDFKRLAAGIASALTINALRSFTAALDDIAKRSRSVGLSARNFQLLSASLGEMGIESAVVQKSLITLQKNLGEAGRGTKTYTDAVAALGLSYEELRKLNPTEQYLAVVDGLQAIQDPTVRAQAGALLLGRAYKDLGTAIEAGSSGIREVALRLEELGIVIDERALKASEEMNDRMAALGLQMRAILSRALLPLIEGIGNLATNIAAFNAEHPGVVRLTLAISGLSLALGGVLLISKGLVFTFGVLSAPVVAIGAAVLGLVAAMVYFSDTSGLVAGAVAFAFTKMYLDLKTIFTVQIPAAWDRLVFTLQSGFVEFQMSVINGFLEIVKLLKKLPFDIPGLESAEFSLLETTKDLSYDLRKLNDDFKAGLQDTPKLFEENTKKARELAKTVREDVSGALKDVRDFFNPVAGSTGSTGFDSNGTGTAAKGLVPDSTLDTTSMDVSDSVSRGLVQGFRSEGVRGAIDGLANALQNTLYDNVSKALSDAFSSISGQKSSGGGILGTIFQSAIGGLVGGLGGSFTGSGTVAGGGLSTGNSFFSGRSDPFRSSGIGGFNARRFNDGGTVPGTGNFDSVPALLTPGETVLPRGVSAGGSSNVVINLDGQIDQNSVEQIRRIVEGTIQSKPALVQQAAANGKRQSRGFAGGGGRATR